MSDVVVTKKDAVDAWKIVEAARGAKRPTTLDYVGLLADSYMELHGDRFYGDDPALVGGVALVGGIPVTFIGNQTGRNMAEAMKRNFGMANPEGYRKAQRLAAQAETFGRPIVTFINTAGAFPGLEAEERGIGEAIAVCLRQFSLLRVPVVSFLIGEGGSGGALAIGVCDELYMLENSMYSVISPEGCASILLRDSARAKEAAEYMKLSPRDLVDFHIADGIIPEPVGGAQEDPGAVAALIKKQLLESLSRLSGKSPDQLVRDRVKKFRLMGEYIENGKKQNFWQRMFGRSER
jgi:acetyl-CoA carboxylase carboxyl transferase subunit alpha